MGTPLTSKEQLETLKYLTEMQIDNVSHLDIENQIIISSFLKSESMKILERLKSNENLTSDYCYTVIYLLKIY